MATSFHGLLAIDAEGFSRNRDAELPGLHEEIRQSVELACEKSGLGSAWRGLRLLQPVGDGLFAVLPDSAIALFIHPFPDCLQEALADTAPRLRVNGLRLRLRAALHAGLVDDERPVTAGISTATNDVHRLLDCGPLRAALADSDPDVTFAAMIVSSEAFDMFVRGGRTALRPSQFTRVRATVKQLDRPAYLYVPVPSRKEPDDEAGPGGGPSGDPPDPGRGPSVSGVSITGNGTRNAIGNQVSGDFNQN